MKIGDLLARPELTLYLVKGSVRTSYYMQDGSTVDDRSLLIAALDEEDAGRKFVEHFNSKTDEYSVYYYAEWSEISEAIGL